MNDSKGMVYPVLKYNDASAAIDWLVKAFGLTEQAVHEDETGKVVHAELRYGGGVIMLGQTDKALAEPAEDDYAIYVAVTDTDAHHDRAVAAGARIVRPLTEQDYGSRDYVARDLEGKVWSFGTYTA
ncbi:VOC family protein [Stackebrandtia nassauensis]|uniref:VOC family protein n=1 Tax=Stackebrandtia nassauensis TaxID=283811 RepID=UPI0009FBD848